MIDVVCLKHGNKLYDWEWVHKLYRGVSRSFSSPINFHVFTDNIDTSIPYNQIQLPDIEGLEGIKKKSAAWWYKVYLFSPHHPLQKRFVYFDLDLVFVGNCDFLLDTPLDMVGARHEFLFDHIEGKENNKVHNSSILVFDPSKHDNLWDKFLARKDLYLDKFQGDQDFISLTIPRDKMFGLDRNKILSWRYEIQMGGVKTFKVRELNDEQLLHSKRNHKLYADVTWKEPRKKYVLYPDTRVVVFNGAHYKQNKIKGVSFIDQYWV